MSRPAFLIFLPFLMLSACDSGTPASEIKKKRDETAAAPTDIAPEPTKTIRSMCKFSGWSSDDDPKGLNVRAAPSSTAKILGQLPPPKAVKDDPEREFATEFDVVEARGGWFRIENARFWAEDRGKPATLPVGWISGRYIDFALQSEVGFAQPNPSSAIIHQSPRWDSRPKKGKGIIDCKGEWVRFDVSSNGKSKPAWFRGVCGVQETSCDGVNGDDIRPKLN
jgi:hypothetical protein